MNNREAVTWLINISADIGKAEHSDLWHYEQALTEIKDMLESAQLSQEGTTKDATSDTISRQAVIDELRKFKPEIIPYEKARIYVEETVKTMYDRIVELPSAQPERKKGRWLPDNRPGGGFWVCSECKFPSEAFAANVLYKFCPNCGADMRGEKDG